MIFYQAAKILAGDTTVKHVKAYYTAFSNCVAFDFDNYYMYSIVMGSKKAKSRGWYQYSWLENRG